MAIARARLPRIDLAGYDAISLAMHCMLPRDSVIDQAIRALVRESEARFESHVLYRKGLGWYVASETLELDVGRDGRPMVSFDFTRVIDNHDPPPPELRRVELPQFGGHQATR